MSTQRIVANPYAKRRKNPPPAPRATATTATTTQTSVASHPIGLRSAPQATTFSQAFEDVPISSNTTAPSSVPQSTTATSHGASSSGNGSAQVVDFQQAVTDASHPDMQPRDHHALLQPHVLYVSTRQRGNGVLQHIRNVPYAHAKMVPDFVMHTTRCALFLSCKYHSLYPDYIYKRLAELGTDFTLRILLVLVDVQDNAPLLAALNKLAVKHEMTLLLAWTEQEAARYLETFKALDGKDATLIQKREQTHFADQVADFLCSSGTSVNKTDAASLLEQFGTVRALSAANPEQLALVTGMGPVKVQRLYEAFHKPFQKKRKRETAGKESVSNVDGAEELESGKEEDDAKLEARPQDAAQEKDDAVDR